jgi:hypothetical protein
MVLNAVLMSDSGACGGLTLPARKIYALGLTKVSEGRGGIIKIKTAGNTKSCKQQFEPAVTLTVKFIRTNGTEESRSCLVFAWCHSAEYESYVLRDEAKEEAKEEAVAPPAAKRARTSSISSSETSASAVVTPHTVIPTSPHTIISTETVSPAQHRSVAHPDDRATIGMDILHRLGAHINCTGQSAVLEIEEEYIMEED